MGKKGKKGKERRDHYYNLAKLQGYRARSAFKLIHIAQKHNIFTGCSVLVDLCAAPGGWLQVAKQNMPMTSTIVGVDLIPIRPIHGCTTIQSDITSQQCRSLLKKEVPMGEVDVVLHDGSPNVGTDWTRDAYVQNELSLHAVKLASELLKPKGIFISKVFRSQDYTSLLWVFQQLFKRVQTTKPLSSRDESAEVFVVCIDYLCPTKIDPKFFDPKFAFSGTEKAPLPEGCLQTTEKTSIKEILRARGKKNRSGYEDDCVYLEITASDFFKSSNPSDVVTKYNKITFGSPDSEEILNSEYTTDEIRSLCDDLKVLGYSDLMALTRWRFKLLRDMAATKRTAEADEAEPENKESKVVNETYNEEEAEKELERLVDEEGHMRVKTERKRLAKQRKIDFRRKMTLGAWPTGDEESGLFRKDEHAAILEEEDKMERMRLGIDEESVSGLSGVGDADTQAINSDGEDEQIGGNWCSRQMIENTEFSEDEIMVPKDKVDVVTGDSENHLAIMEMDLEFGHKMQKVRQARKLKALENLPTATLSRRKRVQMERTRELKDFESQLTARARDLLWGTKRKDEGDKGNDNAEDGEDGEYSDDSDDSEDGEEGCKDRGENVDIESGEKSESTQGELEGGVDWEEGGNELADEMANGTLDDVDDGMKVDDDPMENGAIGIGATGDGRAYLAGTKRRSFTPANAVNDPPDADFPLLPLNEKKLRKLKRAKELAKAEGKKTKKRKLASGQAAQDGEDADADLNALGGKDFTYEDLPFEEVSREETDAFKKKPSTANDLAVVQAMGSLLTKKKSRFDAIDAGYNRYTFNDEECIPEWFKDEEAKHNKPELPLPKELIQEFRSRIREIQERPIRKVLEAKMRKKKRSELKLQKLNKQANIIANSPDMNEASKLQQIRKAMGKAKREDKTPKRYLVSRSSGGALALRRDGKAPKNAQIKVVDKRMKKDKRKTTLQRRKAKGRRRR